MFGFDTLLISAIRKRREELVKFLVGYGAHIDLAIENMSPLKCAIDFCNYPMVALLIELGAKVNCDNSVSSPLCRAVESYRMCKLEKKEISTALSIIKLLRQKGAQGTWSFYDRYNNREDLKETWKEAKALLAHAEKQIIIYQSPETILFS